MDKHDDCLAKIPFICVVAFIFVVIGASITSGMLYKALLETEDIFATNFVVIPWMWYLQIAELLICAVVVHFAVMMVSFAIVVKKRIRRKSHLTLKKGCLIGGHRTAAFFLWTTYLLLFCWLLLMLLLAVPNVTSCMIASVCEHELANFYTGPGVRSPGFHHSDIPLRPYWEYPGYTLPEHLRHDSTYKVAPGLQKVNDSLMAQLGIGRSEPFHYVFNLTSYGVYIQPWKYPPGLNVQETIKTQARFTIFCSAITTVGSLYGCALGGAFLACLGLLLFLAMMSSYKTKLKLLKYFADYKQAASLRRSNDNVEAL